MSWPTARRLLKRPEFPAAFFPVRLMGAAVHTEEALAVARKLTTEFWADPLADRAFTVFIHRDDDRFGVPIQIHHEQDDQEESGGEECQKEADQGEQHINPPHGPE